MTNRRTVLVAAAALSLGGRAFAQPASADGVWHGTLQTAGPSLRLRVEIRPDGSVVLNSLDQGSQAIPGRVVSRSAADIVVEIPAVGGRYRARLDGRDRLAGTWSQGRGELPLTLVRGEPPGPPTPAILTSPPAPLTLERLQAYREAAGAPAIAAIVARRGRPPRVWTTGRRSAGAATPVTDQDLWHIGSMTKSMTATLVARLVEARSVSWDDTVGVVLASAAPQMRAEYRNVTFRHLLSHRSGIPGALSAGDLAGFRPTSTNIREDRRAFSRIVLAKPPIGPAGQAFEYSNGGYVVAGAMLEAKLGESWETLIRRHLFDPLRMSTAGFGPPGRVGALDQPLGHMSGAGGAAVLPVNGGLVDNPEVIGPAGRVHLGLGDLNTYIAAHRDATPILSRESWTQLHTAPFGGDYAMGWHVRPDGILWHNGSNTFWYSEMAFSSGAGWSVAAVVNVGTGERVVTRTLQDAVLALPAI